jgi:hypothetical protein
MHFHQPNPCHAQKENDSAKNTLPLEISLLFHTPEFVFLRRKIAIFSSIVLVGIHPCFVGGDFALFCGAPIPHLSDTCIFDGGI